RETPPRESAHANDWDALAPTTDLESEALRWLGDAAARLLAARAQGSAREEALGILRGGRALALAAVGTETDAVDWQSLGSFHGALGRRREEYATYLEGLFRHPGDRDLRAGLRRAAIVVGRPELALEASRALCEAHPDSAVSRWWLGHAAYEDAGRLRLAQDAAGALARLAEADDAFLESAEAEPDFAASVQGWRARVALSAGFAHLIANDRARAAEALLRAIALEPGVAGERDALDREALDLLDGALEWRAQGPSPVDALALGERLAAADAGGAARWWTAVSDSELREALRAAGRLADETETQAWLETSVAAGRRALTLAPDDPAARHALQQALVVTAEREFERARRNDRVANLLAEAAAADGRPAPAPEAEIAVWEALARALREDLGEARPVTRPGR
ncbi:MAG TPA: hypothetical protein VMT18_09300, partial [Planctomycetota bacterium]|nr:hypothetical protein [Planctomycetota bacterium]